MIIKVPSFHENLKKIKAVCEKDSTALEVVDNITFSNS